MAFYTLVVQVPDEVAQDDLIAAVDGIPWARAEVTFCGPGALVESVPDEQELGEQSAPGADGMVRWTCPGCDGEVIDNAEVRGKVGAMCEECDLIGASLLTDDGEAMGHFSDERIGRVARLLSCGSGVAR